MSEFQTWLDKFLADTSDLAIEGWERWLALPSDYFLTSGFLAILLCLFLLVFVYKRQIREARMAIVKLEVGNQLAQKCIRELCDSANQLHPHDSGIVDNEYGETIEVTGGLKEEFVLETFGRMQSMHNESLEVVKQLAVDNSGHVDAATRSVVSHMGEQFSEVLEKIANQQCNSNKLLLDTVDHITLLHQSTHKQTMDTMQRLVKCVEHIFEESNDNEEDEE